MKLSPPTPSSSGLHLQPDLVAGDSSVGVENPTLSSITNHPPSVEDISHRTPAAVQLAQLPGAGKKAGVETQPVAHEATPMPMPNLDIHDCGSDFEWTGDSIQRQLSNMNAGAVRVLNLETPITDRARILQLASILEKLPHYAKFRFSARANDLISNHPESGPNGEIELRQVQDRQELSRLVRASFEKYFAEKWKGQKDMDRVITEMAGFCAAVSPDDASAYYHEGDLCGLMTTVPRKDSDGENLLLVGWTWINPALGKPTRRAVRLKMAEWLKTRGVDLFRAGINPFNQPSINAALDLGFMLQGIIFQ